MKIEQQKQAAESAGKPGLRRARTRAARIALAYLVIVSLWILISDRALLAWVSEPAQVVRLQAWKGGLFVLLSTLLLFLTLARTFRKDALRERERARQESALRSLSQFQDGVIDNASTWISVLDAQARVTVWNKAAEKISGYSKDSVLGSAVIWAQLYPDESYRNGVAETVRAILEDGLEVEGVQTVIRRSDGQQRTISWSSRRFFAADGGLGSIAIGQDVTEREQMQEELEWIAAHDPLTGLYNRRHFERLAVARHAECKRERMPFALLWVDIDNFKSVNDRFGHRVGDIALREVAGLAAGAARDIGLATRYGGDEIVLALPGSSLESALAVAETLRQRVESASFLSAQVQASGPTLSIGVAVADAASQSLDELLIAADHAMYQAKANGRNRISSNTGSAGFPPADPMRM